MKFGQWLGLVSLLAALILLWSLRNSLVLLATAIILAMALCTVPKGQNQPQNTRPKTRVTPRVSRASSEIPSRVRVASQVLTITRGFRSKKRSTGADGAAPSAGRLAVSR